jgi:anthranilate phosphoribosyltransferase
MTATTGTPGTVAPTPIDERSWSGLITALLAGRDLTRDDTAWAMDQVMTDSSTPIQLAGFLIALRAKGETGDELGGLVEAMLRHAVRIEVPGPAVDVVGTGGDRSHSVNISTMAAVVVAGAGYRVVKHGNRAASSACGTADVLEALGIRLDLAPQRVAEVATEVGITFCFAQVFHPSMRFAAAARRELGVPTVFNFLGPLTNPAQPGAAALGCADLRMAPVMAEVLAARGDRALVFRSDDGLDELTTSAVGRIWHVEDGVVTATTLDATELGLPRSDRDALRGGDASFNAAVVREVMAGRPGPIRDTVLLNAAAGLVAAGVGTGALTDRLAVGLELAADSVDGGGAADILQRWIIATAAR